MKMLAITGFVLAGLINLVPVVGVLGVSQLARLYGVEIAADDVALLLMHRAVLLAIVGALLVAAAFIPSLRVAAAVAGAISMGGYVLLVFAGGVENDHLVKIAWIDVGALGILAAAWWLHLKSR